MAVRTVPAAQQASPVENDAGDEEEEDVFLRESREISVEYVRLLLDRGEKNEAVSLGAGSSKLNEDSVGRQPSSVSRRITTTDQVARTTPSHNEYAGPQKDVNHQIAVRLRAVGDEANKAYLEREVKKIITQYLRPVSVYRVTGEMFSDLCDSVLSDLRGQLSNKWNQISVVYHVMSELVQELRSQTPPNQRNNIQRDREVLFNGFPGQYLREVGLEAWMRKQGGYNAVPDPGLNDIPGTPV